DTPLDEAPPQPADQLPGGFTALPEGAQLDAPSGTGFSDEQRQAILDYLPKATDANDLERYSLELSGGKSKIGNAQDVLDKYKNGARQFGFSNPTVDKDMGVNVSPTAGDQLRNAIGEGILNAIDTFAPGTGDLLRDHTGAGKAFVANTADAAAADYGPE